MSVSQDQITGVLFLTGRFESFSDRRLPPHRQLQQ